MNGFIISLPVLGTFPCVILDGGSLDIIVGCEDFCLYGLSAWAFVRIGFCPHGILSL